MIHGIFCRTLELWHRCLLHHSGHRGHLNPTVTSGHVLGGVCGTFCFIFIQCAGRRPGTAGEGHGGDVSAERVKQYRASILQHSYSAFVTKREFLESGTFGSVKVWADLAAWRHREQWTGVDQIQIFFEYKTFIF